jgi:hypothetical protein
MKINFIWQMKPMSWFVFLSRRMQINTFKFIFLFAFQLFTRRNYNYLYFENACIQSWIQEFFRKGSTKLNLALYAYIRFTNFSMTNNLIWFVSTNFNNSHNDNDNDKA